MAEDNLGTKKDFGVNGKHTRLGEQFTDNEFKGFTLATLREIKERMQRMDEYYTKCNEKLEAKIEKTRDELTEKIEACEEDVVSIDKWKANLEGKIAVIVVLFSAAASVVMPYINSFMQKMGEIL